LLKSYRDQADQPPDAYASTENKKTQSFTKKRLWLGPPPRHTAVSTKKNGGKKKEIV
jgi:hypothetical protein